MEPSTGYVSRAHEPNSPTSFFDGPDLKKYSGDQRVSLKSM